MSSPDANAFISNGTCYIGAGKEADKRMLPCGNDALGHKACCQAGDMCLSSRACYNQEFGVTYLLGCSDPDYKDQNCPDKKGLDQPWAGLVYCNGTSNQWMACKQGNKASTVAKADPCFCPQSSRTVAFEDGATLQNVVLLPTEAGKSVIWQTGHVPTNVPIPTGGESPTIGTSGPTATGGQGQPGPPGSTVTVVPPGGEPSAGLTQGAKIGIGVGVGIAALLFLGIIALIFTRRRKQKEDEPVVAPVPDQKTDAPFAPAGGVIPGVSAPGTPVTPAVSELAATTGARPWSMRSELEGSDHPVSQADREELAAGEVKPATLHPGSASQPRPAAAAAPGTVPENTKPLSPVAELPA